MHPDGAVVATALQKVDCSEDGHVATEAWCEIRNDPVNVESFALSVVLLRPVRLELLGFELDDLFESVDLDLVATLDNRFISQMLLRQRISAIGG